MLVRAKGDYSSKARPAVVIQSDLFNPTHHSITVCPITSQCMPAPLFRLDLEASDSNGLNKPSQLMIDKMFSIRRTNIGAHIGVVSKDKQAQLDKALSRWLQL